MQIQKIVLALALMAFSATVAVAQPPNPFRGINLPGSYPPFSPARSVTEPSRALASLPSYISESDYPISAIRAREQGTTGFRLTVGIDGRVTNCKITASSGSSALDEATCRIIQSRAQFTPARDDHGDPTEDIVSSRMRWVLPAN